MIKDVSGYQYGRDFINYWTAPRLAFHGHVMQLFDLDAYARLMDQAFGHHVPLHNWSYPPFLLPLLAPFAALPYPVAFAAWLLVLGALYLLASLKLFAPSKRRVASALLLLSPAAVLNAVGGQNGFITGALLLGGLYLLPRRPIVAGILFGLLTIKPQLGVSLAAALLALCAWRTIAAATTTLVIPVLLFGWGPWRVYLTTTREVHLNLLRVFDGFFTNAMCSVMATARADGLSYSQAGVVQGLVTVAVLATVVWAVRRTSDWRMRAMVVVLAAPLTTPYAFSYDMTAVSAVLLWRLLQPLPTAERAIYVLAWLAPALTMILALRGVGVMALPLLAAYAVCLLAVRRDAGSPRLNAPASAAAPGCEATSTG